MSSEKPTNPKDALAVSKLPLHLVPSTLNIFAALAFAEGAAKYGAYNWRAAGVRASVYVSALERHLARWKNGEDVDPKTKVPHLSSALACIGIILDAGLCGKLTDDRPTAAPGTSDLIDRGEDIVAHLLEIFRDRNPRHHTRDAYEEEAPAEGDAKTAIKALVVAANSNTPEALARRVAGRRDERNS